VPVILPYSSRVSYETVAVKVSFSPVISRSVGTRHEYPQVPPHPKGIGPEATSLPAEFVIETVGFNVAYLETVTVLPS
jgi:hypothetical protein